MGFLEGTASGMSVLGDVSRLEYGSRAEFSLSIFAGRLFCDVPSCAV